MDTTGITEATMNVLDKPRPHFRKLGCSKPTPLFDHCSYQVGQACHYLRVIFVSFDDPRAVLCTSEEPLTLSEVSFLYCNCRSLILTDVDCGWGYVPVRCVMSFAIAQAQMGPKLVSVIQNSGGPLWGVVSVLKSIEIQSSHSEMSVRQVSVCRWGVSIRQGSTILHKTTGNQESSYL